MAEPGNVESPQFGIDMLLVRLIEAGHGRVAVPLLQQAVADLVARPGADEEGVELVDVVDHLRAAGHEEVADQVEEAAKYLEVHGAPRTAGGGPKKAQRTPETAGHGTAAREVRKNVWPVPVPFPEHRLATSAPAEPTRHAHPDDEELQREIRKVRWFHSIDFGGGVRSVGQKPLDVLQAEADVIFSLDPRNRSVLDIGAWDGYFSVEAARRGASRVLATDWFSWSGPGWGTKAGFDLARRTLAPDIEELEIDVPDLTPERVGRFSIVLFLGVLYHLPHPFQTLQQLADLALECLVLETQMDMLDVDRPAAAFYPWRELNHDPTNWWGPNIPCVAGMLGNAGFRQVYFSRHPTEHSRGIFHAFR